MDGIGPAHREALDNRRLKSVVISALSELDSKGIPTDSSALFDMVDRLYCGAQPYSDWKKDAERYLSWHIYPGNFDGKPPTDYELYLRGWGSIGEYYRVFFVRDGTLVLIQSMGGISRPVLNALDCWGSDTRSFLRDSLLAYLLPCGDLNGDGRDDVTMMGGLWSCEENSCIVPFPLIYCWNPERGQMLGFQECSCQFRGAFYGERLGNLVRRLTDVTADWFPDPVAWRVHVLDAISKRCR